MKPYLVWLNGVLILIALTSCGKKNSTTEPPATDSTKPVINLVDPTSNKIFTLGLPLHVLMDLSDNIELKSYRISIVKNLKGIQTSDWAFSQTWQIAAGKKTLTVNQSEIIVPLTVTGNPTTIGNYDMVFSCADTSGNETSALIMITIKQ